VRTERDVRATQTRVAIELQELRKGSQSGPVGSPLRDVRASRTLIAVELEELGEGSQSEPVGSPLSDVRASRALIAVELQEEPSVLGIRELLSHGRIPLRMEEQEGRRD
jgi:hypothetical protein